MLVYFSLCSPRLSLCRFSGCVLRGATHRPSEAGVPDKTGLPGDPQRRGQEQRGGGAREAAMKTTETLEHSHKYTLTPFSHKICNAFISLLRGQHSVIQIIVRSSH